MHFSTPASEGNFLRSLPNGSPLRYEPGDSSGKFPPGIWGLNFPISSLHHTTLSGDFCASPASKKTPVLVGLKCIHTADLFVRPFSGTGSACTIGQLPGQVGLPVCLPYTRVTRVFFPFVRVMERGVCEVGSAARSLPARSAAESH